MLRLLRPLVLLLLQLLLLALVAPHAAATERVFTAVKSARSNPVLPVVVDGKRVNLLLTTDMDGISLCEDRSDALAPAFKRIDYDYARKLLRYQLRELTQLSAAADLAIPSLGVATTRVAVGVFFLAQQSLSPSALAFFLDHADADGFIGVGYAFRVAESPFWSLVPATRHYWILMKNASTASDRAAAEAGVDVDADEEDPDVRAVPAAAKAVLNASSLIPGQDTSELQAEWDWSEPCASVDEADDLSRANNQGISFPMHHLHFRCTQQAEDHESATPASDGAFAVREVDVFGDFTSSWDVVVDFHSPCLVLPQQFYNSVAGWTGLTYNEDRKVSELGADARLPPLTFALSHDGPTHVLDLNALVMAVVSNGTKAVCIQRSASIVHNGASVFAPIDTESTAQRYRLHGTMMLPVYNMQQTPIVFGTMVLAALGEMVVDGDAKQVALRHPNRTPREPSSHVLPVCEPAPECIGQQEFSARLNACLDPACASYYFEALDPDAKVCVINADWLTFLFTTVAVFVAAELILSSTISRTVRGAIARASASY